MEDETAMSQYIPATTSDGQQVMIMKEGSQETKGKNAQQNNIFAGKLLAELVKTSLGPRGMDKMLVDTLGDVTITNDGATILKEIDVRHPAAKMLIETSKAIDNEVGDGTTSSVVLTGALLENAEELISHNVHPTIIVEGYRKAADKAIEIIGEIAFQVPPTDKKWLTNVALIFIGGLVGAQYLREKGVQTLPVMERAEIKNLVPEKEQRHMNSVATS